MFKKIVVFLVLLSAGKANADQFLIKDAKSNYRKQIPSVLKYIQKEQHERTLMTAGRVSRKAFAKYHGNFDKYLDASLKTRRGKVFEEMFASYLNSLQASRNGKMLFVPTAAINSPQNSVDILGLGRRGKVFEKYQLKMSAKQALDAVNSTKYLGQKIVIPEDQLDFIKSQLNKRKINAKRRGINISSDWANIENSIQSGYLIGFSNTSQISAETQRYLKKEFDLIAATESNEKAIAQAVFSSEKAGAQATAKPIGKLSKLQVLGKCIVLADYALNVVTFASELGSFMNGDLDGRVFAGKTGLKAVQIYLGYVALADLEPFSKAATTVFILALVAADFGMDAINSAIIEPRKAYTARILAEIEPLQRGAIARDQLLEIYHSQ